MAPRYDTSVGDERLRELERKWKSTRSVEDHAAYLQARVRAGDLEADRLELAAYCGHAAARAAVGARVVVPDEFEPWVLGLSRFGREAVMRAGLTAAEVWGFPFEVEEVLDDVVGAVLEPLRLMLHSPTQEVMRELQTYTAALEDDHGLLVHEGRLSAEAAARGLAILHVAGHVSRGCLSPSEAEANKEADLVLEVLAPPASAPYPPGSPLYRAIQAMLDGIRAAPRGPELRQAIAFDLVRWSLGQRERQ
jgi:hypothetical protein